jgi:hypothetical protein
MAIDGVDSLKPGEFQPNSISLSPYVHKLRLCHDPVIAKIQRWAALGGILYDAPEQQSQLTLNATPAVTQ